MSKLLRGWPVALLLVALPGPARALDFGCTIKQGCFEFTPWPYEAHFNMPAPCAPWNAIPMTLPPNFRMYPSYPGCGPGQPGMGMPPAGMPMPALAAPGARPGAVPPLPPLPDKPADRRPAAQPVGYTQPAAYPPVGWYPPSGCYPPSVPWSYYQAPSWYYGR